MEPTDVWMIDFDDVVLNFSQGQCKTLYETHGVYVGWDELTTWNFWFDREPKWLGEFVWGDDVFHSREWTLAQGAWDGAVDALNALDDRGIEWHVVTARPSEHQEWLESWLAARDLHPQVICTGRGVSKVECCLDLGVTIAVDDAPHNVRELTEAGIVTYMPERPFNRDFAFDWPSALWAHRVDSLTNALIMEGIS